MTAYLPRLRVQIEHGYYAQGQARGLRLRPSAATATWLREHDAVWRDTGDGLMLSAPRSREPVADTTLVWTATSDDPLWTNVTQAPAAERPQPLCLRSLQAAAPGGPAQALQTEAHSWALHPPGALAWAFDSPPGPRAPALLLALPAPALHTPDEGEALYRGALLARAPLWQYWLVGDWARGELRVEDSTPETDGAATTRARFEAVGLRSLRDGQAAQVLRSASGIALRERADYRFQLRGTQGAVDRVLVKRLPVAGADHFARETIHGVPTLVSDIFVHR